MAEVGGAERSAGPPDRLGPKLVQPGERPAKRLNSWKEIADYIGRDVRTAFRWERNGMPVHRLMHEKNPTVYALSTEIDAWLARRSTGPAPVVEPEPPVVLPKPGARRVWIWGGAAALAIGVVAVLLLLFLPRNNRTPQIRMPAPLTADAGWEWGPQLSPDGRNVAYTRGGQNSGPQVVVQLIGGGQPVEIAGPEANTYSPAWSPDGNSIALLRQHPERPGGACDVIVLPAFGGAERKIAEAVTPAAFVPFQPEPYLAWSPDGRFLAVSETPGGKGLRRISLISVSSGEKRALTEGMEKGVGDSSPSFSPDGRRLAFTRVSAFGISDVLVLELTLDMRPVGAPRRIPSDALWNAAAAWTPDGRRLVFTSGTFRNPRLKIANADGKGTPVLLPVVDSGIGPLDIASVGSNQVRLVYTRFQQDEDIWKIPLGDPLSADPIHAGEVKVVDSSYLDVHPRFSPDGKRFAFGSNRTGYDELWVANADGSQPLQLTKLDASAIGRPAWNPDGQRIAFELLSPDGKGIFEVGVADGRVRQLVPGGTGEAHPEWSRDGEWLYFSSRRSGIHGIWKMPAGGGEPVPVFDRVAGAPLLTPDGKSLVYTVESSVRFEPLDGAEPLRIFDDVYSNEHIDVTQAGIYGAIRSGKEGQRVIAFYSFSAKRVHKLFSYPRQATGGLSISPDGKYALASMRDHVTIDLMMVDGLDMGEL